MRHWLEQILAPKHFQHFKRKRWKLLREGADLSILLESTERQYSCDDASRASTVYTASTDKPVSQGNSYATNRAWDIVSSHGSVKENSIKCVLRSTQFGDLCEMVVLFPGSVKSAKPSRARATVCVSSQIGCGVGCRFCATGTMGFRRNLSTWEILEQIYIARRIALQSDRHLRNIVFMGMGEPLHNAANLHEALRWIVSDDGFGFAPRHVTVSTSGVPKAMTSLALAYPDVRLALSLHSADEKQRRALMPRIGNDLEGMRSTIKQINSLQKDAPIWLEYILIAGVNDSDRDAQNLIQFSRGLQVEINLIPFNPIIVSDTAPSPLAQIENSTSAWTTTPSVTESGRATELGPAFEPPSRWRQPTKEVRLRFANTLRQAGLKTTIRQSFGQDENAACGQLVVLQ